MGKTKAFGNKKAHRLSIEDACFMGIKNYRIRIENPTIKCFDKAHTIIYIIYIDDEPNTKAKLEEFHKFYCEVSKRKIDIFLLVNMIDKAQSMSIDSIQYVENIKQWCASKNVLPKKIFPSTLAELMKDSTFEDSFYSNISFIFQHNLPYSTEITKILSILKDSSAIIGSMLIDFTTNLCMGEFPSGLYENFNCVIRNSLDLFSLLQVKESQKLPHYFEYKCTLTVQRSHCIEEEPKDCPLCEGNEEDGNKIIAYIVRAGSTYSENEKDLLVILIRSTHMRIIDAIKYNIKESLSTLYRVVDYISERNRKEKELGII